MPKLTPREKTILQAFAWHNDFCWACGIDPRRQQDGKIDCPRDLQTHHIAKFQRRHEDWNLSRLCHLCHDLAEGHQIAIERNGKRFVLPKLKAEHILFLKHWHDRENWNPVELQKVWRARKMPSLFPPPEWFRVQWALHRRSIMLGESDV